MKLFSNFARVLLQISVCILPAHFSVAAFAAVESDQWQGWKLSITPDRQTILVGEQVVLRRLLRYDGAQPFSGNINIHPALLVTRNRQTESIFWRRLYFEDGDFGVSFDPETFQPGHVAASKLHLLYDFEKRGRFFAEAGTYEIKLQTTMMAARGDDRKQWERFRMTSNAITITVRDVPAALKPAFELWSGKEQAEVMLHYDSYHNAARERPQALGKLEELIRLYSESPYAQTAMRRLKKIGAPQYNQFLPEDKRLDARIEVAVANNVTFAEKFKSYSQQGGVPLLVAEPLQNLKSSSSKRTSTLRTEMKFFGGPSSEWVWEKQGDGYLLRPKTPAELAEEE